jgi:hypothetical protein
MKMCMSSFAIQFYLELSLREKRRSKDDFKIYGGNKRVQTPIHIFN